MAVTRTNILEDESARARFIEGTQRLKKEVADPASGLSTYDLFVVWHHRTMYTFTPPGQSRRNSAHQGPVFLPWHRFLLMALEQNLQRVLEDDSFGLPYWPWNLEGDLSPEDQLASPLWADDALGGDGVNAGRVADGPFRYDPEDPDSWRVRVRPGPNGSLRLVDDGLRRSLGKDISTLPTSDEARASVALADYDHPLWGTESEVSFRNVCEGWAPDPPGLHNRVHVWIGGDMAPSTSPNDPAFYLNHCNVDRMWAAWQRRHPGAAYLPGADADADLLGHRLGDTLVSMFPDAPTIESMIEVDEIYAYDRVDDLL